MPGTTEIITASGRTLEEVKAGIRIRMRNMVNSALEIGIDLTEAKEACRHGEWMPFLREIGLSASTAANYMRIAKEVSADSRMAALPYTKILALLAAPPEDREALADAAEDMSAAEIRRLTDERNKAAEAANAETRRADQAEADAKMFNQENAGLRNKITVLEDKLEKAEKERHEARCDLSKSSEAYERQKRRIDELHAALLEAENNRVEVEKLVEVIPEDYNRLKMEQKELLDAAARAEERASEAEAELERLQMDEAGRQAKEKPVGIVLSQAMNVFFGECELMPFSPAELQRDRYAVEHCVGMIREWCQRMDEALDTPVITEANVI
jgi:hypothetical protein